MWGSTWVKPDGETRTTGLPRILTSIDAAASLMPEGWWMPHLRQEYGSIWVRFDRLDGKRASGASRTEPQARTAAALRAMAVEGETRHGA
jgi:hypothetical protein